MEFSIRTQTTAPLPSASIEVTGNVHPKTDSLPLAAAQRKPSDITFFENYSNPMLAKELLDHFRDLEGPDGKARNSFRLTDLKKMAAGKLHDGRDAKQEQIELAKEVISRPDLMTSLFPQTPGAHYGEVTWNNGATIVEHFKSFTPGVHYGETTWNNVALIAEDFKSLSDGSLLGQVRVYFREFAEGANDEYVNFNELREAAREIRSTRDFSYNATAVAKELLNRPYLLRQLDITRGAFLHTAKPDDRFNLSNITYTRLEASDSPHRPA